MAPEPDVTGADPADEAALAAHARALGDGIDAAIAPWVVACVERVHRAWTGVRDDAVSAAAADAGARARTEVVPRIRRLLDTDIDEQRTSPLAIVRDAVRFPTEVLTSAGVPPVVRDAVAEAQFPDDAYDLTPGSLAELDPSLREVAIAWGAAKAFVHLARRRAAGG